MKKIVSLSLCLLFLVAALTGCGKKDRQIFQKTKLEKYVELCEYKGIEIDTSSKDYEEFYNSAVLEYVDGYNLYKTKKEGKVQKGDTANIDYVGKKNGVAFEGGTAEGYDLTIGSGSFIDGFEDGLIGVSIGDTVDLNLTFPENYQSEELAGKAVVFTVKVNYVTTDEPREAKDYYAEIGFDSLEEYESTVKNTANQNYLINKVVSDSKVKDYPEADSETMLQATLEYHNEYYVQNYNMTLKDLLTANNSSLEAYSQSLSTEAVPQMLDTYMVLYHILDTEGLEIDSQTLGKQDIAQEVLKENYAVREIVAEYLVENAKIK